MTKMPLYLTENWKKHNKLLLKFDRKFQKVVIKDIKNFNKHCLKVFKKYRNCLKEISIEDCIFEKVRDIKRILDFLPNLEGLKLHKVEFTEDESEEGDVNLPMLKSVRIMDSNLDVFGLLKTAQITTLKIKCSQIDTYAFQKFKDFLSTQKKLKSLALRGLNLDNADIFETDISENIEFKLHK